MCSCLEISELGLGGLKEGLKELIKIKNVNLAFTG